MFDALGQMTILLRLQDEFSRPLENFRATLDGLNKHVETFGDHLRQCAEWARDISTNSMEFGQNFSRGIQTLGKSMAQSAIADAAVLRRTYNSIVAPIQEVGVQHEADMAQVFKVVDGAGDRDENGNLTAQAVALRQEIELELDRLAKSTAIKYEELAGIFAAAGRLGFNFDAIGGSGEGWGFGQLVAEVSTAIEVNAGEAADLLGVIFRQQGFDQYLELDKATGKYLKTYKDLAGNILEGPKAAMIAMREYVDMINWASDNSGAKALDLMNIVQRLGIQPGQMNFDKADTLAVATYLNERGFAPDRAATAFRIFLDSISVGSAKSGKAEEMYELAGMSKEKMNEMLKLLSTASKGDAEAGTKAMMMYAEAYANIRDNAPDQLQIFLQKTIGKQGKSAIGSLLEDLTRENGMSRFFELRNKFQSGMSADSVRREFANVMDTAAAQMQQFESSVKSTMNKIWQIIKPTYQQIIGIMQGLTTKFNEWVSTNPEAVRSFFKIASALAAVTSLMISAKFAVGLLLYAFGSVGSVFFGLGGGLMLATKWLREFTLLRKAGFTLIGSLTMAAEETGRFGYMMKILLHPATAVAVLLVVMAGSVIYLIRNWENLSVGTKRLIVVFGFLIPAVTTAILVYKNWAFWSNVLTLANLKMVAPFLAIIGLMMVVLSIWEKLPFVGKVLAAVLLALAVAWSVHALANIFANAPLFLTAIAVIAIISAVIALIYIIGRLLGMWGSVREEFGQGLAMPMMGMFGGGMALPGTNWEQYAGAPTGDSIGAIQGGMGGAAAYNPPSLTGGGMGPMQNIAPGASVMPNIAAMPEISSIASGYTIPTETFDAMVTSGNTMSNPNVGTPSFQMPMQNQMPVQNLAFDNSNIPAYGTGGFVDETHLAIVGDEPEWIIPAKGDKGRNLSMLAAAAAANGVRLGGQNRSSGITITGPIYISVPESNNAELFIEQLSKGLRQYVDSHGAAAIA